MFHRQFRCGPHERLQTLPTSLNQVSFWKLVCLQWCFTKWVKAALVILLCLGSQCFSLGEHVSWKLSQHSDLAQRRACGTFHKYAIFQDAFCSTEMCLKTYEGNSEEMAYTRHWLSTHIHVFTKMKVFENLCRVYAEHAIHQLWEPVYWTIIQLTSRFTTLREFENPRGTYRESGVYSTLWKNTEGGIDLSPTIWLHEELFEKQVGDYAESALYSNQWNSSVGNRLSTNLRFHQLRSGGKLTRGAPRHVPYTQLGETTLWWQRLSTTIWSHKLVCDLELECLKTHADTYAESAITQLCETTLWDNYVSISNLFP